MRSLESSRIDYDVEKALLWETLGGTHKICGIEVSPITPAIWCFLWLTRSPLCPGKSPTVRDVAVALYLLTHNLNTFSFQSYEESAMEYAEKIKLSSENITDVWKEIVCMVERTFSPLQMLPRAENNVGDEPMFDTDWFLSVCSVAANEANVSLDEIASHYPLSAVFALMVIRSRKANPGSCFCRHTPEYVGKRMLQRTEELAEEFLNKKES